MTDPLDELFVDEEQTMSSELLVSVLKTFVQLTAGGGIHFLPPFYKLGTTVKILVALLAKKALARKVETVTESTNPKELQGLTGLSVGSVNPTLRNLANRRLVIAIQGAYTVPAFAMTQIKEILDKELKK